MARCGWSFSVNLLRIGVAELRIFVASVNSFMHASFAQARDKEFTFFLNLEADLLHELLDVS